LSQTKPNSTTGHDTNIYAIISALGLTQFNQSLPETGPPSNQQAIVSHMTPFGARMLWEIIQTPHPLKAQRPAYGSNATMDSYYNTSGSSTTYVHVTLSQRTIPLWKSYSQCEERDDGWCEMSSYLDALSGMLEKAQYEYSCFGNYPAPGYGNITDGVPLSSNSSARAEKRALGGLSLVQRAESDAFSV
jgi:hypothetical protein